VLFSLTFFGVYGYTTGKKETMMLQNVRAYDLFIGVLHYVGSLCTNMGFAHGSASLVQCVKLLEPIETLILMVIAIIIRDRVLSRSGDATKREISQILSVRKVASTFVIIGGTMMLLTQKSMDPNPKSIVFALVSGFCMASRNVLKKTTSSSGGAEIKSKKSSGEAFVSGIQSFAFITTMAAIPAVGVTMVCHVYNLAALKTVIASFSDAKTDAVSSLSKAVIFHCLYNVFSITVLCLTSATTHSLLNVGKRIVNVIAAAAYFGVALSLSGKGGIALAAVGAFLFNDNSIERIRKSALGKYFVDEPNFKVRILCITAWFACFLSLLTFYNICREILFKLLQVQNLQQRYRSL
jgi:F0F1-type ATP synthase assembly protein I